MADPKDDEDLNERSGQDGDDEHREQLPSGDEPEGGGADEADELDEDQAQEEIDAAPSQLTRGESRQQRLANQNRELMDQLAERDRRIRDTEERLARLERPQAPQEREPTEDEIAMWSPAQVMRYTQQQAERRYEQRQRDFEVRMFEVQDKSGWDAYCNQDPQARRLTADVEREYVRQRQAGNFYTRGQIYTFLVGQRTIERSAQARTEQGRQGARRIERQRANGASPKGQRARGEAERLTPDQERDRRLESMEF